MTGREIDQMLTSTGLPVAYHSFPQTDAPATPFIVWLIPGSDDFFADDINYLKVDQLSIELYTDSKDFDLEENLEAILTNHDITWRKAQVWIESERMFETIYDTEVLHG